jgi:tRNA (mo5U34)-methyltransferase
LDRQSIEREVKKLGPWFHNMELGGVLTAPGHFLGDYPRVKFQGFAHALPTDLRGKSVLDVGCNAGFYSLEMKRRGADRVVGIDSDDVYLAQASFAAEVTGLDIELRKLDVYEVAAIGERFDVVIFMGVLYHLRHPLLALDLVHDHVVKPGSTMVFQSMQRGSAETMSPEADYPFSEKEIFDDARWPKMHFVERSYSNDWTNWWIPNRACTEGMLRSSGFRIDANPEPEVYMCSVADTVPRAVGMGTRSKAWMPEAPGRSSR